MSSALVAALVSAESAAASFFAAFASSGFASSEGFAASEGFRAFSGFAASAGFSAALPSVAVSTPASPSPPKKRSCLSASISVSMACFSFSVGRPSERVSGSEPMISAVRSASSYDCVSSRESTSPSSAAAAACFA